MFIVARLFPSTPQRGAMFYVRRPVSSPTSAASNAYVGHMSLLRSERNRRLRVYKHITPPE